MQKDQDGNNQRLGIVDSAGIAWVVCDALAVLTEPFVAIGFGKNYFGRNMLFGGLVMLAFLLGYPQHQAVLTGYGTAWLAAIVFQVTLSRWNHYFGARQITTYVGIPLLSCVLPFGDHFCRRIVTPLLIYGASYLVDGPPLSTLFALSAVGHVVSCGFRYLLHSRDEDARSDAILTMRSR